MRARRCLIAGMAILPFLTSITAIAQQQPVSVRYGVLSDMSGSSADLSGQGSVIAARMAVEDFGAADKNIKADVIGGDHQNKADVGARIAREWYDREAVDVIVDAVNSAVALAVSNTTREKNKILLASGPASSDLTGKECTPNTIHWSYDTWSLGNGTGRSLVEAGSDTWFFLTVDYALGTALERDTTAFVTGAGGKVLGSIRIPLNTPDYSSFLLQAQASKAKVVALANAGNDSVNSIKQAGMFGIAPQQKLAGLLMTVVDVHALGLETAHGLVLTESFYWNLDEKTRGWSNRFQAQNPRNLKPTMVHAGVYSSVLHHLKLLDRVRSNADGMRLVAEMKATPTDDPLFGKGSVRADGRKLHPIYVFEVKSPAESQGPWDYYKVVKKIPATEAFRPMSDGNCPLTKT